MNRISLIGIPGSGKSELAEALSDHIIRNDGCECKTPVSIIDDYVSDVSERLDLAAGFDGFYVINVAIALERLGRERTASGKTVITCGSLIETTNYASLYVESHQRFWTTPEEEADNAKRTQAFLLMLGCLYMDSFNYDTVYYLPPVLPVSDDRMKVLDRNIQAAFQVFPTIKITPLAAEGSSLEEVTANRIKLIEENDEASPIDRS